MYLEAKGYYFCLLSGTETVRPTQLQRLAGGLPDGQPHDEADHGKSRRATAR